MSPAFDSHIAEKDWLQHRWQFEIRPFVMQGEEQQQVCLDRLVLRSFSTREQAHEFIEQIRVESLAAIIARNPHVHPAVALIEGGLTGRLARIRPELWATYDGIELNPGCPSTHVCVLSAKARALFPAENGVFIRIWRRDRGG